jgi:hypothetical protein
MKVLFLLVAVLACVALAVPATPVVRKHQFSHRSRLDREEHASTVK